MEIDKQTLSLRPFLPRQPDQQPFRLQTRFTDRYIGRPGPDQSGYFLEYRSPGSGSGVGGICQPSDGGGSTYDLQH